MSIALSEGNKAGWKHLTDLCIKHTQIKIIPYFLLLSFEFSVRGYYTRTSTSGKKTNMCSHFHPFSTS